MPGKAQTSNVRATIKTIRILRYFTETRRVLHPEPSDT